MKLFYSSEIALGKVLHFIVEYTLQNGQVHIALRDNLEISRLEPMYHFK